MKKGCCTGSASLGEVVQCWGLLVVLKVWLTVHCLIFSLELNHFDKYDLKVQTGSPPKFRMQQTHFSTHFATFEATLKKLLQAVTNLMALVHLV